MAPVFLLGTVLEELFAGFLLQPVGTLSHHGLFHFRHMVLRLQKTHEVRANTVSQLWQWTQESWMSTVEMTVLNSQRTSACSDVYGHKQRETQVRVKHIQTQCCSENKPKPAQDIFLIIMWISVFYPWADDSGAFISENLVFFFIFSLFHTFSFFFFFWVSLQKIKQINIK